MRSTTQQRPLGLPAQLAPRCWTAVNAAPVRVLRRRAAAAAPGPASPPAALDYDGIRIICVTRDVIVVHKPPGLSFHSDGGGTGGAMHTGGLVARLRARLADPAAATALLALGPGPARAALLPPGGGASDAIVLAGGDEGAAAAPPLAAALPARLYPIHRLDAPTSGIVLFASSPAAAGLLARAFRERRVAKYYAALSARRPSKSQGTVAGAMARARGGAWRLVRSSGDSSGGSGGSGGGGTGDAAAAAAAADAVAVTRFVSAGAPGVEGRAGLRAFLLKPETGRTHQLRVALKSLGSPVLGDALYAGGGGGAGGGARSEARAYLHAAALRVVLPDGSLLQVVDPPSEGELFEAAPVRALFDTSWLPLGTERDRGAWLSRWPLLASDGAALARGRGEAAAAGGDSSGRRRRRRQEPRQIGEAGSGRGDSGGGGGGRSRGGGVAEAGAAPTASNIDSGGAPAVFDGGSLRG